MTEFYITHLLLLIPVAAIIFSFIKIEKAIKELEKSNRKLLGLYEVNSYNIIKNPGTNSVILSKEQYEKFIENQNKH